MEKIVTQGLLYDFYGELLTEHQKKIYEEAVFNDMSLSEIAEEFEISRQGVHDLLKRCNNILQEYENKLRLMEKFMDAREKIRQINELAEAGKTMKDTDCREQIEKIRQISNHLIDNF